MKRLGWAATLVAALMTIAGSAQAASVAAKTQYLAAATLIAEEGELAAPVDQDRDRTSQTLRSVAEWEALFLNRWDAEHTSSFLPMSLSTDSWDFYGLAYGVDGNVAMFRATGKTQYLDRALQYANNMVASARPSNTLGSNFHDAYLGWKSQRSDVMNQEVPLFESYCWRYVTQLLRAIRDNPSAFGQKHYRRQYKSLLEFTEKNIFEKWFVRGPSSYIYRENTHMTAHWALISLNLSRLTKDATRKANYLAVLDNINHHLPNYPSSLRRQMIASPVNSAAYFWSDRWNSFSRPGQDVAHGNGVMAYIVEGHDSAVEWTDSDIRKFVVTLNSVVWPSATLYANHVDGSGTGNGWYNDGFVKLGRYDADLQARLERHTVGQNTQFYGNGALNAWVLGARARR